MNSFFNPPRPRRAPQSPCSEPPGTTTTSSSSSNRPLPPLVSPSRTPLVLAQPAVRVHFESCVVRALLKLYFCYLIVLLRGRTLRTGLPFSSSPLGRAGFGAFGQQQQQQQQQPAANPMFGGASTSTTGATGFGTTINPQLLTSSNPNTMQSGAFGGAGGGGTTAFGAAKPGFGAFGGTSTFGQPTTTTTSAFGQPSGTTAFGANTGTSLFGKPAATTTFGAPSQGQLRVNIIWSSISKIKTI